MYNDSMNNLVLLASLCWCVLLSGSVAEASDKLYDGALSRAVKGHLVDYKALCADLDFKNYLKHLALTDPATLDGENERLAFWLNAYNAYNVDIVCQHYPLKNLNQLHAGGMVWAALRGKTVWDKPVMVGGKAYTLKDIEHEIIKKDFNEPFSQFALACGSISCPSLRNEPYRADQLKVQLANQATIFFANEALNRFDLAKRTMVISPIMNWNLKSFGRNSREMLLVISDYLPSPVGEDVKLHAKQWKISYSPYDLIVNDTMNPLVK